MTDYVDFDDCGIVEIKCMNCGTVVAGRTYVEVPSRREIGKMEKVLTIKRYNNWRQIKVDLSDGTFAEPIVCTECEHKDIDMGNIERQIKKGWEKEMVHAGKSIKEIIDFNKKIKPLKVKGRMVS